MSREIRVCWLGRHRRGAWETLCGRYRERIEPMARVRDVPVLMKESGPDAVRVEKEAEALLAALPEPCWTVALDRRGRRLSSEELARWLEQLRERWPHPIAFLVGSDLGLGRKALSAARERLSLGPLTLPHELARLLLYEQLYRSLSLSAGIKYHRQPL
ncbi:MAG: 23S rRNA (pseudouridine(1915)-N(3))-methyltransferase RlmH [Thermoanaerobaculia bacterium]